MQRAAWRPQAACGEGAQGQPAGLPARCRSCCGSREAKELRGERREDSGGLRESPQPVTGPGQRNSTQASRAGAWGSHTV